MSEMSEKSEMLERNLPGLAIYSVDGADTASESALRVKTPSAVADPQP
jgi:hypothetical protein